MLKSKEIQINETNARNVFSETIMNKKFESNFLNQVKQDSHHKETFSYIYIADLFKFPIAKIEIFSTPYIPSISGAFLIFTHTESLSHPATYHLGNLHIQFLAITFLFLFT